MKPLHIPWFSSPFLGHYPNPRWCSLFLPPSTAPTPTPGVAVYFSPFPLLLPKPHVEELTFPRSVGSFTRREKHCVAFNNKKETIKAQLAENMDI